MNLKQVSFTKALAVASLVCVAVHPAAYPILVLNVAQLAQEVFETWSQAKTAHAVKIALEAHSDVQAMKDEIKRLQTDVKNLSMAKLHRG